MIGNKAQQIAVADGILQTIAMAKQDPAASTLFPLEKIFNAIKSKLTAAGIKDTDEFIAEPQRDEQGNVVEPELPPDPAIAEAQARGINLLFSNAENSQDTQIAALHSFIEQDVDAAVDAVLHLAPQARVPLQRRDALGRDRLAH